MYALMSSTCSLHGDKKRALALLEQELQVHVDAGNGTQVLYKRALVAAEPSLHTHPDHCGGFWRMGVRAEVTVQMDRQT